MPIFSLVDAAPNSDFFPASETPVPDLLVLDWPKDVGMRLPNVGGLRLNPFGASADVEPDGEALCLPYIFDGTGSRDTGKDGLLEEPVARVTKGDVGAPSRAVGVFPDAAAVLALIVAI